MVRTNTEDTKSRFCCSIRVLSESELSFSSCPLEPPFICCEKFAGWVHTPIVQQFHGLYGATRPAVPLMLFIWEIAVTEPR